MGLRFLSKKKEKYEYVPPQFDPWNRSSRSTWPMAGAEEERFDEPPLVPWDDEEHTLPGNESISPPLGKSKILLTQKCPNDEGDISYSSQESISSAFLWTLYFLWLYTDVDSSRKKPYHAKSFLLPRHNPARHGERCIWRSHAISVLDVTPAADQAPFSPLAGTKKTCFMMNASKITWERNFNSASSKFLIWDHSTPHLAVHSWAILWHHIHTITALLPRGRRCLGLPTWYKPMGSMNATFGTQVISFWEIWKDSKPTQTDHLLAGMQELHLKNSTSFKGQIGLYVASNSLLDQIKITHPQSTWKMHHWSNVSENETPFWTKLQLRKPECACETVWHTEYMRMRCWWDRSEPSEERNLFMSYLHLHLHLFTADSGKAHIPRKDHPKESRMLSWDIPPSTKQTQKMLIFCIPNSNHQFWAFTMSPSLTSSETRRPHPPWPPGMSSELTTTPSL